MDAFNFVFSLFGLLLGFSLAEVLSGFAKALNRRHVVRLGWLTPLLAVFLMLDLTGFWSWAWGDREQLAPAYGILIAGLFVSGLYYLAASIVFPSEFGEHTDFDQHYIDHRRFVLGAVFICNLIPVAPDFITRGSAIPGIELVQTGLYFGALIIAWATRNKAVNIAALAILIAVLSFAGLASVVPILG